MAHTMILCVLHGHRIMIRAIYHELEVIFCLIINFMAIFSRPKYWNFCLSASIWAKIFIIKAYYDSREALEHLHPVWIQELPPFDIFDANLRLPKCAQKYGGSTHIGNFSKFLPESAQICE